MLLPTLGHLLEAQLSAGTVNARLAALKSFVTHAYKRKLCAFRLDDIKSMKAQTYKDTRGISTAEDGAQASTNFSC
jgi:integrase/recombinase XerC